MPKEVIEVKDIKDFFLAEKFEWDCKPVYAIDWESNNDYISIIKADFIEVPMIMPEPCENGEAELHKFLDYIVDNHKALGIECLPEKHAIDKLSKSFGTILKYKNVLVKEDSLVMPFDDESYGIGLLDAERMIIIKPQ
jgi:hypothetical protein